MVVTVMVRLNDPEGYIRFSDVGRQVGQTVSVNLGGDTFTTGLVTDAYDEGDWARLKIVVQSRGTVDQEWQPTPTL